jgi:CheY-like chemotaxis protein
MVAAAGTLHPREPMPVRVLIVDDDARFRRLARAFLERSGFEVAGEAADGAEALAVAARARPDAALVDVQLPDIDGPTLAAALSAADGGMRILLTSSDPGLGRGVTGFVAKDRLAVTNLAPWLGS